MTDSRLISRFGRKLARRGRRRPAGSHAAAAVLRGCCCPSVQVFTVTSRPRVRVRQFVGKFFIFLGPVLLAAACGGSKSIVLNVLRIERRKQSRRTAGTSTVTAAAFRSVRQPSSWSRRAPAAGTWTAKYQRMARRRSRRQAFANVSVAGVPPNFVDRIGVLREERLQNTVDDVQTLAQCCLHFSVLHSLVWRRCQPPKRSTLRPV